MPGDYVAQGEQESEPVDDATSEAIALADEAERAQVAYAYTVSDLPADSQGDSATPSVVTLAPDDRLRRLLLVLLFALIIVALAMICLGLAIHWFDTEFGKTILQVIVGPAVGAIAVVIGYLFGERRA